MPRWRSGHPMMWAAHDGHSIYGVGEDRGAARAHAEEGAGPGHSYQFAKLWPHDAHTILEHGFNPQFDSFSVDQDGVLVLELEHAEDGG